MILDFENLFSWNQAVTVTAVSTNVIDLGPKSAAGNANGGRAIPITLAVGTAFTAAGAGTLTVAVEHSDAEGSGFVVSHQTGPIAVADLALTGPLPMSLDIPPDSKRYVRLNYTVGTGPMTAGTITAGVTMGRQTNR